jgi:tRNA threonylcarbamoyladenosine biosynthesis protein TsaB
MKVLGIDTSTPCGSVGLIDEDRVLADFLLNIPVTHSERLLSSVDRVLQGAGWSLKDVEGWALSLGPGSFTGLRIGVSVVKGLAFATGRPVAGVPTLDVLAFQIAPTPYLICPILDARKEEVYTAFYRYGEDNLPARLTPYQTCRPEGLIKQIREKTIFIGDGVKTYGDLLRNHLPSLAAFPISSLHLPHGSTVARLALDLLRRGETLDLAAFTPIYVRPSEAELKWREKPTGETH